MAFNPYYQGYMPANQQVYYPPAMPEQPAQLRQSQMQPMMQGAQMVQQPQQLQSQMPTGNPASGTAQNGMIWVSGRADADGYLVAPNSAVPLWDANNPVIYLRKADSTGKPSTVVYDLVERVENTPTRQDVAQAPQIDLSQYVTIDQLEDILSERLKRPVKATQKKEDADNG